MKKKPSQANRLRAEGKVRQKERKRVRESVIKRKDNERARARKRE